MRGEHDSSRSIRERKDMSFDWRSNKSHNLGLRSYTIMIPNKDLIEALVMVSATSAAKLIHDRMKGKVTTILMVVFQYIVAFITVYVAYPFIK